MHVLIRDSVSGTCIGETVVEWYMQRHEICESGRFQARANCKHQRSRLNEAKRILERYVTDNNLVHIVDEARYWSRILSMTTPNVWYNVSLQCSYYDCQDFASKCKHLLAIQMIIESHMPSLCGSLPFIDHATKMRMDDATMDKELESTQEAKDEMNVEVDEREEIKLQAHQTMEALQRFEHGLGAMNNAVVECCWQLMVDFRKELLLSMHASATTNMASGASIS